MSATGLDTFDKTLQTTNIWLGEIMEELGPDRQRAYHALRAVLGALRDRLTIDQSAHLAAQLPLLVRGVFYDGWDPSPEPTKERKRDEFLSHVASGLQGLRPMDVEGATRAVFAVLGRHLSEGEVRHIREALPGDIRRLWPDGGAAPTAH